MIPVAQKVFGIVAVAIPIVLIVIWFVALELSHRIAGPLFRLEKELDTRLRGDRKGPIKLREHDELKNLAEKINRLIEK